MTRTRWARRPGAVVRKVGHDLFVASPDTGTIHAMNPVAAAAWEFLAEPHTLADLYSVFEAAFSEVDADRIRSDLDALLKTLAADGLIIEV